MRYRLSPQHAFPAALLDLLVAYLSLLYPPLGAYHTPVPASCIVLTGDSSGANMCLALIQTILEFGREQSTEKPTIRFNGRDVALPVPAGVATLSAYGEIARALPSWTTDRQYDIFNFDPKNPIIWTRPDFPADAVWPSSPPRGDLYCDSTMLCHPLVSPAIAQDWTGAPPMLLLLGEEKLADCINLIAQRATAQGVKVVWQQFEAMPHIFPLLLQKMPQAQICYEHWANFCTQCVEEPGKVKSTGTLVDCKTLHERAMNLKSLTMLTRDSALKLMCAEASERAAWTGPSNPKHAGAKM